MEELTSFDNTGNVCVWASEEVLAHFCLQNKHIFKNKKVCELAAGLSGLAGLCVSLYLTSAHVLITDGNVQASDNITYNISLNNENNTNTKSQQLLWDTVDKYDNLGMFDVIIAADCIFLTQYHYDLLHTFDKLLEPGSGVAYILAPKRGTTLTLFVTRAHEAGYNVHIEDKYDNVVWGLHEKFKGGGDYDEDIHYPVLLKVYK